MLNFRKLIYEDTNVIYKYLEKKENLDTDYAKTTLLCWYDELQIATDKDFVVMKYICGGKNRYFSPLAVDVENYTKAIAEIEEYEKGDIIFLSVNEKEKDILTSLGYQSEDSRDYSEYLYNAEDLIHLSGKKYHAKRNFINGFNNIPYTFREYQKTDKEELIFLMQSWDKANTEKSPTQNEEQIWIYHVCGENNERTDFEQELAAVSRVVDDLQKYNAFCDVLLIDGKIAGFCVGEIMPHNVGAIYFQKANVEYKGIYALLDHLFCQKHFLNVPFINKQEDMGLSGLRKSKESYYPVCLVNKFTLSKN